jgi:hypothetical protein
VFAGGVQRETRQWVQLGEARSPNSRVGYRIYFSLKDLVSLMMDRKIELDGRGKRKPDDQLSFCQCNASLVTAAGWQPAPTAHSPSPILSYVLGWQPLAALPCLTQICFCPTEGRTNVGNCPTAACRHLPWRHAHAHAAIMQQGFCVDALNIAWPPDGAYTVSMYRPVTKQ